MVNPATAGLCRLSYRGIGVIVSKYGDTVQGNSPQVLIERPLPIEDDELYYMHQEGALVSLNFSRTVQNWHVSLVVKDPHMEHSCNPWDSMAWNIF